MAWSYRRMDVLAPLAVAVWVLFASFLSPLRSQILVSSGGETPLVNACLCNGDALNTLKLSAAVLIAALCALSAALARRVRWPLWVMAALGWLLFSMWAAVLVASYYAGSRLRSTRATAYLVIGTTVLVAPALLEAALSGHSFQTALGYSVTILALMIAAPFFYGLWVRARRTENAELQEVRAARARELERDRIAREMHDVVAHRVSLMVLHAGALELAARDERTRQAADLIRTAGREAMTELRQVLGVLRDPSPPEPQPTLKDIEKLIEQIREAGVPVQFHVEGNIDALPSTVERTAYRLVQEGLTNVVKHAGLPETHVRLIRDEQALTVSVVNGPPKQRAEPMPSSGLGLIGLRERIGLLQGTFEAASQPGGGFLIRAQIPVCLSEAVT